MWEGVGPECATRTLKGPAALPSCRPSATTRPLSVAEDTLVHTCNDVKAAVVSTALGSVVAGGEARRSTSRSMVPALERL